MNADMLHDAISLLPEDMLAEVDTLRRKKRVPWKSIGALAACLCLTVGLWFFAPGAKNAMDSAENGAGAPQKGDTVAESAQSGSTAGYVLEVLRVDEGYAIVFEPSKESADACLQMSSVMLTYENLEETPQLKPGQTIRIYYKPEEFSVETLTVRPYKIEIIEEETQ